MANTVSLCMIVRDEGANLRLLLGDVASVIDEIHVVDTGSTDDTIELLQEMSDLYRGKIHRHHFQWQDDFAQARAYSFSFATQDWIFWLDGDDRIDTERLSFFIKHVLDSDGAVDSWSLRYLYTLDVDGTPLEILERERFVRRSTQPSWSPRIHERLQVDPKRCRFYPNLEVVHRQGLKPHAGERDYRILRDEFAKNPEDPEILFFFARELWNRKNLQSVELFERFLRMPDIRSALEIRARYLLGEYYHADSRHEEVLDMAHAIYKLDHTRRRSESYYLWGITEQAFGRFQVAIAWFERCLDDNENWPRRHAVEFYSDSDLRTWRPLRRIAECYAHLGQPEKVQRAVERLGRQLPDDEESRAWRSGLKRLPSAAARPGAPPPPRVGR